MVGKDDRHDGRPWFTRAARSVADAAGSPAAFLLSFASIAVWLALGPLFQYSDSWQLIINTGTTILTFLMVFLIQNTQNRDARILHLKLDELIRALAGARDELINIDTLTDEQIDALEAELRRTHAHTSRHLDRIEAMREHRRQGVQGDVRAHGR